MKILFSILGALAIAATFFGIGFVFGDKWANYQIDFLKEELKSRSNRIKELEEKTLLLEKSKPELSGLLDEILKETVYFISSYEKPVDAKRLKSKTIGYGESYAYNNILYLSFSDFIITEKIMGTYGEDNEEVIKEAKGKIVFGFGTYKTDTTLLELKIGDTLRFILDGETYIILLKEMSGASSAYFHYQNLKLRIEIYKII